MARSVEVGRRGGFCWAASLGGSSSSWVHLYLCICVFQVFVSNLPYGFLISTSVVRSVKVGGAGCAGRPRREKEALALGGASFPPPAASWWEPSEGGDQW